MTLHRDRPFPEEFLWGVGTSGYQTEGGDRSSNWAAWERAGRVQEPLGIANDAWHRFEEDLDLCQDLALNAFRLSFEWARLEPEPGRFDPEALNRYREMIQACLARGLTPIVTLCHFTIPQWLEARGGWTNPDCVDHFRRYAEHCAQAFAKDIRYWITINEPNSLAVFGYLMGLFPPGRRRISAFLKAYAHLLSAHGRAYEVLHRHRSDAMVSVNLLELYERPDSRRVFSVNLNAILRVDRLLEDLTHQKTLDFIAIDYYYGYSKHQLLNLLFPLRWPVYPEGIYQIAKAYHERYRLPLLVAENGLAMAADRPRADGWTREAYLVHHLRWIHRAIEEGVPVIGYVHWTLADSYEWGSYRSRFGLYRIDRHDPALTRQSTEAAKVYAQVASANSLSEALQRQYYG